MNRLFSIKNTSNNTLFGVFTLISIVCLMVGIRYDERFLWGVPILLVGIYAAVINFRILYFLLIACIPISMEFSLSDTYATDMPTEPLIVALMFIYWFYIVKNGSQLRGGSFIRHPLTICLLMHLAWIYITTINSEDVFFSVKYSLAKTWYIVTFYFVTALLLLKKVDYQRFAWFLFIPLFIAVIVTIVRHAATGFSFEEVNFVMQPMFRNHVNYACTICAALPFVWMLRSWQIRSSYIYIFLSFSLLVFIVAIQLSYTRAAYVAIIGAIGYYFIVQYRLTKLVLALALIAFILFTTYMIDGNRYLDFAPKFERTITYNQFDNLLEATAKGEDISTMERVYRWVAGANMVIEKPFMGFGPNNFYNFYKNYTVNSFKTYVSDNPDHSTVHCYYLLLAIEQGIPGFLIFMALVVLALLKGEQVYHRKIGAERNVVMAALLSLVSILILILINDMIETDKIGSFFFIDIAIIANLDLITRQKENF